jgi:uncharacterized membrane protein SpoIIM required for sporulation
VNSNVQTIRTIARREVTDTLSDWRILIPMFILSFILPELLIAASGFAIDFVGDANIIRLLVPFAMLLVGFIPASFSLITALESFVGERERNSLESLLAMPISDSSLYIAKLLSSLIPPLLSSLTAMLVFAFSLYFFRTDLFYGGLTLDFLLTVLALTLVKSLMMVAGAIIISTHTTSIRAANLLASFVLLPTASIIQLEAILMIGSRWDVLRIIVLLLLVITIALIRTGMNAFNREEILSREHEEISIPNILKTWRRFFNEYQPAGVTPDLYKGLSFSFPRFYRVELPAILYEYRLPIAVAIFAALVGLLSGGYIGQNYQVRFFDRYLANIGKPVDSSLGLALYVFANNFRVSLFSNVFSLFSFGTFAFLVPSVAFAQVSFVANTLASQGGSWFTLDANSPLTFLLAYVVPHGIIELPTAILSTAFGLRIGIALLSPPKGFSVGQNIMWSFAQYFKVWLFVLVPLFFIGSMIEGLITPLIVQMLYAG